MTLQENVSHWLERLTYMSKSATCDWHPTEAGQLLRVMRDYDAAYRALEAEVALLRAQTQPPKPRRTK